MKNANKMGFKAMLKLTVCKYITLLQDCQDVKKWQLTTSNMYSHLARVSRK